MLYCQNFGRVTDRGPNYTYSSKGIIDIIRGMSSERRREHIPVQHSFGILDFRDFLYPGNNLFIVQWLWHRKGKFLSKLHAGPVLRIASRCNKYNITHIEHVWKFASRYAILFCCGFINCIVLYLRVNPLKMYDNLALKFFSVLEFLQDVR